jgi:serine O-acetyltransferase
MIDHGTGVVIGETSVVEDNVSILQGVTLGGTGKEAGDRHPKVRRGVMIGAGAGIFGNIEIGARAKVGAGSIVLKSVPTRCTTAGVPARLVGPCDNPEPAQEMDQSFDQEL